MREPAPGSGATGAVVRGVDATEEAALRVAVRCSPANLPAIVTLGAALPKIPQIPSSFEGKTYFYTFKLGYNGRVYNEFTSITNK